MLCGADPMDLSLFMFFFGHPKTFFTNEKRILKTMLLLKENRGKYIDRNIARKNINRA